MFENLIPKDMRFFELLDQGGVNAQTAIVEFCSLINNWKIDSPSFQRIRDIEQEGDRLTHEIMDKLNRTFVTPIDREDIHELAGEIDDICDILQALSDRMQLYELGNTIPADMVRMADVLVKSGQNVQSAVAEIPQFRRKSRIRDYCIRIKGYENEADDILKNALANLFKTASDPLYVMKWKEIFETIESAHDKCSSIANTLEGIIVKNA